MTPKKGVQITQEQAGGSAFAPQVVSVKAIDVIQDRVDHPDVGVKTGIESVDRILNPHRPGELRTILGYTSNYKSGFMNFVARYNALRIIERGETGKKAVITVTWEQSIEEQGVTDLAQISQLDITKLMRGELLDNDWHLLMRAAVKRGTIPWWLVGHSSEGKERRPRLSMTDLARVMEYIVDVQKITPELVCLDYFQRIKREGSDERTREQYMEIADRCKDMALAFHVPVMLGSQAGRKTAERSWRLPQLVDMQETSALEQESDSVVSLWMPKNDYPLNDTVTHGDNAYVVTNNLLIMGIIKQKFGISPYIIPLYVKPEINEIYTMEQERGLSGGGSGRKILEYADV